MGASLVACCAAITPRVEAQAGSALLRQVKTVQVRRPEGVTTSAYQVIPTVGVRSVSPTTGSARDGTVSLSFIVPGNLRAGRQPVADIVWGPSRVTAYVEIAVRRAVDLHAVAAHPGPRGEDAVTGWVVNGGNVAEALTVSSSPPPGTRVDGPSALRIPAGDSVRLTLRVRHAREASPGGALRLQVGAAPVFATAVVRVNQPASSTSARRGAVPVSLTIASSDGRGVAAARVDAKASLSPSITANVVAGPRLPLRISSALGLAPERGLIVASPLWRGQIGEVQVWDPFLPSGGVVGRGANLTIGAASGSSQLHVAVLRPRDPVLDTPRAGVASALGINTSARGLHLGAYATAAPGHTARSSGEYAVSARVEDTAGPTRWRAQLGVAGGDGPVGELAVTHARRTVTLRAEVARTPRSDAPAVHRAHASADILLAPAWWLFARAYASGWDAPLLDPRASILAARRDSRVEIGTRRDVGPLHVAASVGTRDARWEGTPAVSGPDAAVSAAFRVGTLASIGAEHERVWTDRAGSAFTRVWASRFAGTTTWSLQGERGARGLFTGFAPAEWRYSGCGQTRRGPLSLNACLGMEDGPLGYRLFTVGDALVRAGRSTDLVLAVQPGPPSSRAQLTLGLRVRTSPPLLPARGAGVVYDDRNGNGRRDVGESGVSGVPVVRGDVKVRANARGEYAVGDGTGTARAALEEFEPGWLPGPVRKGDIAITRGARVQVRVRFSQIPLDASETIPSGRVRLTAADGSVFAASIAESGTALVAALPPGSYLVEHTDAPGTRIPSGAKPARINVPAGELVEVELLSAYHPRRIVRTMLGGTTPTPRTPERAPPSPAPHAAAAPQPNQSAALAPATKLQPSVPCPPRGTPVRPGLAEEAVRCILGPPALARRNGPWTYLHYSRGRMAGGTDVVWIREGRVIAALLRGDGRRWIGPDAHTLLQPYRREIYETAPTRR